MPAQLQTAASTQAAISVRIKEGRQTGFTVENQTATRLWLHPDDGLFCTRQARRPHSPRIFFSRHNHVKARCAGCALEELEEIYFGSRFEHTKFLQTGKEILEASAVFQHGSNHNMADMLGASNQKTNLESCCCVR